MFFSMGHGGRVIASGSTADSERSAQFPSLAVTTVTGSRANGAFQSFGYLFAGAPEFPEIDDIDGKLRDLAQAMQETVPDEDALTGTLPPIFTYLGQFIDHDISVNTDRDNRASHIGDVPLVRQPRATIEANIQNGRKGSLRLDSLYGDAPNRTEQSKALERVLRNGPFLREGMTSPVGTRPDLPVDGGDDLPRIGMLIDQGVLDADMLPIEIRPEDPTDHSDPKRCLAFIGDGRNDENLIVAQLHLAFIRFHNAVVREILASLRAPLSDDAVFEMARQQVIWVYQWIIVNEFLPAICRRRAVEAALAENAPVYTHFLAQLDTVDAGDVFPLPLEFSVACYRFGHTMVRDRYDYNRTFGRPNVADDGPRRASLDQLFQFTGRTAERSGEAPFGAFDGDTLPHNWLIEWDRFVDSRPVFPDRLARAIDTHLAPSLFDLLKEEKNEHNIFVNLAVRNLRRGYNINLPAAQEVLAGLRDLGVPLGRVMTKTELTRGATGRALRRTGLHEATPLWFYILKEAEEVEKGYRLGAVGSAIVADTIVGLIHHDKGSYLHQSGKGPNAVWHPSDGVMPNGCPVASITELLAAAGVLHRRSGSAQLKEAAHTPTTATNVTAGHKSELNFEIRNQIAEDVFATIKARYFNGDPNWIELRLNAIYPRLGGWVLDADAILEDLRNLKSHYNNAQFPRPAQIALYPKQVLNLMDTLRAALERALQA